MMGSPSNLDGPQVAALERLLVSIFAGDAEQLSMFLRRQEGGAGLVASLRSADGGMEKLAHAAVLKLAAEGRIVPALFGELAERAPNRVAEIAEVERQVLGSTASVAAPVHSHVLVLQGQFPRQYTLISLAEVRAALAPGVVVGEPEVIAIDAPGMWDPQTWRGTRDDLSERVRGFVADRVLRCEHQHVSIFALAPIPLLLALGHGLGDAIPTRLYGRLREPGTWSWQATRPEGAALVIEKQMPRRPARVALLLSISARIARKDVDRVVPARGRGLVEVALESPRVDAIRSEAQLFELVRELRGVIAALFERYGRDCPLHVFAAAPAPVLVALGQSLPRRAAPAVYVHEFDARVGFGPGLEIIAP